jgi:Bacterial Ig domain
MMKFIRFTLASLTLAASTVYAVPPTVSITAPANNATFAAPASITINATAADSDGTVSKVEFFNGATKLGQDTTSPYSFNWTNVAVGTYTITAKATDNSGAVTTSAAITVKVNANVAPAVSISAPLNNATFVAPAAITISATAADTDGTIAKVEFYNGTTLLGSDTTSPYSYAWSNVAAGTYSVTAKATDDKGAVTTSSAISVVVAANKLPTVSISAPANNASFVAPASIAISATAADTDGTIAKVEFYNGTTLLGSDTTSPYAYTWANVAAGTYSITAKATDDKSAVTTSSAISVTVAANQAPTVSITSPAANASYAAPASITISANATDADGTISKVEFYNGTTLLGSDTTSPYSYAWSGLVAGTYSITAKATDSKGAVTTSAAVSISVVNNQLPTITFDEPADNGPTIYAPANITLGATASDADGTITKVEFFKSTTKLGEATSAPYRFAWANVAAGTYSLTAKVTDNRGASTTSSAKALTVAVNSEPASILFFIQGLAFRDKAVYQTSESLMPKVFFSFSSGGKAQRAQIYANSTLLCETVNASDLSAGGLSCPGSVFAVGTYTISATVTGPNGAITAKTFGTIYVESTPSISAVITKPTQGETLWAGRIEVEGSLVVPVGATFKLYQNTYPCGQYPQFDVELPTTVSGSKFTAAREWDPLVVYPPNCIRAVVTASDGKSAQSTVSNIQYQQATAVIVSPAGDVTVYSPTIVVDVLASIPPSGRVEINGVVATQNGTNFRATLQLAIGQTEIKATVIYAGYVNRTSNSVFVTYKAPVDRVLTITSPVEGAKFYNATSIETGSAVVSGSVTGGDVTTVLVRDTFGSTYIAEVLNGSFNVPIAGSPQDNWIEVVAYGSGGATARKQIHFYITNNATDDIVLTSPTACSVTPPANITLSALARTAFDLTRVDYYANNTLLGSSTSAAFDFLWSGMAVGSYQISANSFRYGTNSSGVREDKLAAVSRGVKITVAGTVIPPTVSLTAPVNNTTVGSPVTLTLSAQNIAGTIATVEFLDGSNHLIGYNVNSASSNYTLNYVWEDATSGSHVLTARVTNSAGVTLTTAPVTVTVRAAPTVNLSAAGAFYLAPGNVDLLIGAAIGEPGTTLNRVEIYSSVINVTTGSIGTPTLVSTLTAAPYRYRLTNMAAGTYRITARAVDSLGNSRDSAPLEIRVASAAGIALPATLNGSTINSNTLSFVAAINAPANSSITVNGAPATMSRDGRVIVNGLALNPGVNTVTISVTPPSGPVLTQDLTVTRTPSPPSFDLTVNPTQGIAPVTSLMEVKNPGNTLFAKVLLSCHNPTGDISLAESQSNTLAGAMECRYTKSGLYRPWAAIKDSAGTVIWTSTKSVAVFDQLDTYAIIRGVYFGIEDRLKAGDATGAANFISEASRPAFSTFFASLGSSLTTVGNQLGQLQGMTITDNHAELILVRATASGPTAFPIHITRDPDGVWRIESM